MSQLIYIGKNERKWSEREKRTESYSLKTLVTDDTM